MKQRIPTFLDGYAGSEPTLRTCDKCRKRRRLSMFRSINDKDHTKLCAECEDKHWRKAYRYGQ